MSRFKKYYRCHCPRCGKNCAAIPMGGDYLNAVYPAKHKGPDGERCDGCYEMVDDILEPDDRSNASTSAAGRDALG